MIGSSPGYSIHSEKVDDLLEQSVQGRITKRLDRAVGFHWFSFLDAITTASREVVYNYVGTPCHTNLEEITVLNIKIKPYLICLSLIMSKILFHLKI